MIIGIVGSRNFPNRKLVFKTLESLNEELQFIRVVSGGARGVDSWADAFAAEHGIDFVRLPAKWNKHGRAAGMFRNTQLVDEVLEYDWPSKGIVAFWDAKSNGTKDTITKANDRGLPVLVVYADGSLRKNEQWIY